MSYELEFIGPNDKPALLALSTPEWLDAAKNVLSEIGYKVHAASNHDDFMVRFGRIHSSLRVTPAMEAGVSDHVWTIEEIVDLVPVERQVILK